MDSGTHTYKLFVPDGFEEEEDFMNLDPLVIGLHGRTSLRNHYYVMISNSIKTFIIRNNFTLKSDQLLTEKTLNE